MGNLHGKIFVGNLCEFAQDEDLSQQFRSVTNLISLPACVARRPNSQSLEYGFVAFPTVEEKPNWLFVEDLAEIDNYFENIAAMDVDDCGKLFVCQLEAVPAEVSTNVDNIPDSGFANVT